MKIFIAIIVFVFSSTVSASQFTRVGTIAGIGAGDIGGACWIDMNANKCNGRTTYSLDCEGLANPAQTDRHAPAPRVGSLSRVGVLDSANPRRRVGLWVRYSHRSGHRESRRPGKPDI